MTHAKHISVAAGLCDPRMGFFVIARSVLLSVALFVGINLANAAEEARKTFDIPAGTAPATLKEFSAQAGGRLLYNIKAVEGVTTQAVKGEFTANEALEQMLAGTPLVAVPDSKNGALSVVRDDPAKAKNVNRAIAENSARPSQKSESPESKDGPLVLDTFEVFGKKSLNMDIRRTKDDTQPYVTFDREEIRTSGATNLTEFFQYRVTAGSPPRSAATTISSASVSSQTVDLRGFGSTQTLILVDGRRLAKRISNGSPQQPDISGIPLSAVERIEILPATASGIYGAEAVGGVINIILRRDYSGADVTLAYTNAFDTDAAEMRADLSASITLERGRTNLMFTASWTNGSRLSAQDRDFYQRFLALRMANVTTGTTSIYGSASPIVGATTNIRSSTGTNLTLKAAYGGGTLNSQFTFVPYGYAGPASDNGAGLIASAGRYNFDAAQFSGTDGALQSLWAAPRQENYSLSFRREMSKSLTFFSEASRSVAKFVAPKSVGAVTFSLPGNSTANPFNETIMVTTPGYGTEGVTRSESQQLRLAAGAIAKLSRDWQAEADVTYDSARFRGRADSSLATSANVLSAVQSGSLNVFRDTLQYPTTFSPYLNTANMSETFPTDSSSLGATLRGSGPLGGSGIWRRSTLSGSFEYRQDKFDESRTTVTGGTSFFLYPERSQDNASAYVELRARAVDDSNSRPWAHLFELMVAGRFDRYSTQAPANTITLDANGNRSTSAPIAYSKSNNQSANPTVSLLYEPVGDLMFRVSYGTGFIPPNVGQLGPAAAPSSPQNFAAQGLVDPLRGNEPVTTVSTIGGGNPGLRPETNDSWSAGLVFKPRFLPRLRASVDWVRIDKVDAITTYIPLTLGQAAFSDFLAAYPERVVRDSPSDGFSVGKITGLYINPMNIAKLNVEAIDYALEYSRSTTFGEFEFSAKATQNLRYEQQPSSAVSMIDSLGTSVALNWNGFISVGWKRGPWTVNVGARWFDSYYVASTHAVNAVLGSSRIPAQHYENMFVSYRFGSNSSSLLRGTELSLGINNVFNQEPPADSSAPYYSRFTDPRLATYTLKLRKAF